MCLNDNVAEIEQGVELHYVLLLSVGSGQPNQQCHSETAAAVFAAKLSLHAAHQLT